VRRLVAVGRSSHLCQQIQAIGSVVRRVSMEGFKRLVAVDIDVKVEGVDAKLGLVGHLPGPRS
jgi:hypothetical protein